MPVRPSHSNRVIASVIRVWSCSPSGVVRRLRRGIIDSTSTLLRDQTGVDFSEYKLATLERRVERRMNALGLKTKLEYASFARRNSREIENLYRDLLISVTSFFRDSAEFETLSAHIKDLVDEVQ